MERLTQAAPSAGEPPPTSVHFQARNDLRPLRLRGLGHVAVGIYVARRAAPSAGVPRRCDNLTPKETR